MRNRAVSTQLQNLDYEPTLEQVINKVRHAELVATNQHLLHQPETDTTSLDAVNSPGYAATSVRAAPASITRPRRRHPTASSHPPTDIHHLFVGTDYLRLRAASPTSHADGAVPRQATPDPSAALSTTPDLSARLLATRRQCAGRNNGRAKETAGHTSTAWTRPLQLPKSTRCS